jgi:hypothetical protein
MNPFFGCGKRQRVQGTERYLFLREVLKFMLAKPIRSFAEPEDPTVAIHRLLGLLETVVNQQADLIEEIVDSPHFSYTQELHPRAISTRAVK